MIFLSWAEQKWISQKKKKIATDWLDLVRKPSHHPPFTIVQWKFIWKTLKLFGETKLFQRSEDTSHFQLKHHPKSFWHHFWMETLHKPKPIFHSPEHIDSHRCHCMFILIYSSNKIKLKNDNNHFHRRTLSTQHPIIRIVLLYMKCCTHLYMSSYIWFSYLAYIWLNFITHRTILCGNRSFIQINKIVTRLLFTSYESLELSGTGTKHPKKKRCQSKK